MLISQTEILQITEYCQLLQHLIVFLCLGNWRTAFQPEKTSLQEFHVDESTTVMAPLMTHTGQYHYLNDKVNHSSGDLFIMLICVFLLTTYLHSC